MRITTRTLALAFLALWAISIPSSARAQGTAFTYQGRLASGGNPANGTFDLTFALFNLPSGPGQIGSTLTNSVAVSNGLFTTTLDFGNQFSGADLWLEIGVRPNGGAGFSTLTPRQQLTPVPYAVTAEYLSSVTEFNNLSPGGFATIGGGVDNTSTNDYTTVGGGYDNTAGGQSAAVGGGQGNEAIGYDATVGGGAYGVASGAAATVAGGDDNSASGDYSTVGGGLLNNATGWGAVVGGGGYNGSYVGNFAGGVSSTVSGGFGNTNNGNYSTISGGAYNLADSAGYASMIGGSHNTCSGYAATVAGGQLNTAAGSWSFAAGNNAQALHTGSFVWSDKSAGTFASTANNQFSVRAAGGVVLAGDVSLSGGNPYHNLSLSGGNSTGYLYGSFPALGDGIHLGYNWYADSAGTGHVINPGGGTSLITTAYGEIILQVGAVNTAPSSVRVDVTTAGVSVYGTFNNNSDRNAKQDFAAVSPAQILDKVLQLPVTEWSYKVDAATRHIGPVAQDFSAAFNIGTDDRHIAPIDEGGVALAAIQGLNQKLEATQRALHAKDGEIQELQQRLEALENMIHNQPSK